MTIFNSIFLSTFLMYLWFNTDAFVWWCDLFGLKKVSYHQSWIDYKISTSSKISYLDYLFIQKKTFFFKLISCKPCLLFWICLPISIFFNSVVNFPIIYILSYIFYALLSFIEKKLLI